MSVPGRDTARRSNEKTPAQLNLQKSRDSPQLHLKNITWPCSLEMPFWILSELQASVSLWSGVEAKPPVLACANHCNWMPVKSL